MPSACHGRWFRQKFGGAAAKLELPPTVLQKAVQHVPETDLHVHMCAANLTKPLLLSSQSTGNTRSNLRSVALDSGLEEMYTVFVSRNVGDS